MPPESLWECCGCGRRWTPQDGGTACPHRCGGLTVRAVAPFKRHASEQPGPDEISFTVDNRTPLAVRASGLLSGDSDNVRITLFVTLPDDVQERFAQIMRDLQMASGAYQETPAAAKICVCAAIGELERLGFRKVL